jgi:Family of unknown function (DUF5760)
MYSAGRTNIDEITRRQLLDNYLRNQQTQSTVPVNNNAFNISSGTTSQRNIDGQFHPSQFQSPLAHNDARSETFSDISRRSQPQPNTNSLVQVNEQRATSTNETSMTIVPVNELPDNISIDDFTNLVQKWIELDNWIKKSQEIAKQKRKSKDKLGEVITHYMTKFNIEDLNTSEGKIRCKVRYVKSGVNQKVVKEKIAELLKDNEETCNTLITKIFEEREKVEKVSLRRIKIT